jgi:hypothetical protein
MYIKNKELIQVNHIKRRSVLRGTSVEWSMVNGLWCLG